MRGTGPGAWPRVRSTGRCLSFEPELVSVRVGASERDQQCSQAPDGDVCGYVAPVVEVDARDLLGEGHDARELTRGQLKEPELSLPGGRAGPVRRSGGACL